MIKPVMKRIGKALFVVVVMFAMMGSMVSEASAAYMHLNYNSVRLSGGLTAKLKVNTKKKVKWSSSNKKVASVSSKGLVKGKKKGKCTITAKVGKKKMKCKVTIISNPTTEEEDIAALINNANWTSNEVPESQKNYEIHIVGDPANNLLYYDEYYYSDGTYKGFAYHSNYLYIVDKDTGAGTRLDDADQVISSDSNVVEVSANDRGLIFANKPGTCTLTVIHAGKTMTINVSVEVHNHTDEKDNTFVATVS